MKKERHSFTEIHLKETLPLKDVNLQYKKNASLITVLLSGLKTEKVLTNAIVTNALTHFKGLTRISCLNLKSGIEADFMSGLGKHHE